MTTMITALCALAAAAHAQHECTMATALKPCCSLETGTCTEMTGPERTCTQATDCGENCTVAFSETEQRTCNDGGYARLIGLRCDACPEDSVDEVTHEASEEKNNLSAEEIGAIVGGSVGGVVLGIALYACWQRRREESARLI